MAEDSTEEQPQEPISVAANAAMADDDDDEEEIVDEEEYEEDDEEEADNNKPLTPEAKSQHYESMRDKLLHRLTTERVPLLVHNVLIKGNTKTKDSLIESQLAVLKSVSSAQELIQAAKLVILRLRRLGIFDSVSLTIDSGPPELPGTANVVVDVVESRSLLSSDIYVFADQEAKSWSFGGSLKLKNLFGYGDIWDSSLAYGWNQLSEVSAGVSLPQFKRMIPPVMARISLPSQDWLKLSSYKKQAFSLSLGLLSSENHDLSYTLSGRTSTGPSQLSSGTVRSQPGYGSLSALKYTFHIDRRNSPLRPTRGFAFVSTSQIGGVVPDYRSLRFIYQEFDFRVALPLGFYGAALNFGVSAAVNFPWGSGYSNFPLYLPQRFFTGGNFSPVRILGGPTSALDFKSKGLGPAESRKQVQENTKEENSNASSELDHVGADLAVTAFADLSFDLPLRVFRDAGIHGHAFACTGSLNKLTENAYRDLPFQKFRESFRSSAGLGIVFPTQLFRMEVNYCYTLKQLEHDQGKTGLQIRFSSQ